MRRHAPPRFRAIQSVPAVWLWQCRHWKRTVSCTNAGKTAINNAAEGGKAWNLPFMAAASDRNRSAGCHPAAPILAVRVAYAA